MAQRPSEWLSPDARDEVRLAYSKIRNFLAGQHVGATRDSALLQEVIRALFTAHLLWAANALPQADASQEVIRSEYERGLLKLQAELPEHFPTTEGFASSPSSLAFIHQQIARFDFESGEHDYIGEAYEAFTGSDARGAEGQFFTPQQAVHLLVDLVAPTDGERIIDPACGAGGFLSAVARRSIAGGGSPSEVINRLHGIDKDDHLARLAAVRLAFFALASTHVECADSLGWRRGGSYDPSLKELEGTFDVVLTNPPFGSRIVAGSPDVLSSFALGHKWTMPKTGAPVITDTVQRNVPPQVLFLERCLSLVKPGGRVGMVVPESMISGRNYRYVISWLRERAELRAVIGMPEALFKTSGKGGTHTKTALLYVVKCGHPSSQSRRTGIFMAEARYCGNDSRGRSIPRDDLPEIAHRWREYSRTKSRSLAVRTTSHLGYVVSPANIISDILCPRYYDPETEALLANLSHTHHLVKLGDLVASGVITISAGHEVGAEAYGSGDIPFVRTSDISNWEIKLDPKQGLSADLYDAYAAKQDVKEADLLMVRDGTYLIGTCAFVTRYDTRIVFQSHILKLRVNDPEVISPFLLLAALSSPPVRRQVLAKRFTQDIIDSLGNRVLELVLPIPKDPVVRSRVESMVETAIHDRVEARELARKARVLVAGATLDLGEEENAQWTGSSPASL